MLDRITEVGAVNERIDSFKIYITNGGVSYDTRYSETNMWEIVRGGG
jgi:hypothetical protein